MQHKTITLQYQQTVRYILHWHYHKMLQYQVLHW